VPVYDYVCPCGYQALDQYESKRDNPTVRVCPACQATALERTCLPGKGQGTNINPDDIPGGLAMRHGVCHEDGTPRVFYSRSAIRAALKAKGYVWGVDVKHVGKPGSDKHPDSVRWR
jgi:hypothetical protein